MMTVGPRVRDQISSAPMNSRRPWVVRMESEVMPARLWARPPIGKLGAKGAVWLRKAEMPMQRYNSFRDFYPFYLSEHAGRTTRRLHFLGSSLALFCLLELLFTGDVWWIAAA